MSPSGSTQVEWTLRAPCPGEAECAGCVASASVLSQKFVAKVGEGSRFAR